MNIIAQDTNWGTILLIPATKWITVYIQNWMLFLWDTPQDLQTTIYHFLSWSQLGGSTESCVVKVKNRDLFREALHLILIHCINFNHDWYIYCWKYPAGIAPSNDRLPEAMLPLHLIWNSPVNSSASCIYSFYLDRTQSHIKCITAGQLYHRSHIRNQQTKFVIHSNMFPPPSLSQIATKIVHPRHVQIKV